LEKPVISEDVVLGEGVRVFQPDLVNLYGCTIGAGTKIGAFVEIRKDVSIGRNCKIQAFVFIPEGVTIGEGVFLGPHVCFTNDRFPAAVLPNGELMAEDDWTREDTSVGDMASIGANATILCGIAIGERAMVGAGAVVTKDVPPYAIVKGNPAVVCGDVRDRKRQVVK
jgi:UDP-2-acetamido-3-amino-2,3-dideoxy-glucuronate N-acetyltransferase